MTTRIIPDIDQDIRRIALEQSVRLVQAIIHGPGIKSGTSVSELTARIAKRFEDYLRGDDNPS